MNNKSKTILLATMIMLVGCQGGLYGKKTTVSPRSGQPVTASGLSQPPSGVRGQLSTCLFEADQLVKLNAGKYRGQVNALYEDIRAAKYYASVAGNLSTTTTDTITPMYQFRVNDACNTISQLLLTELKQGGVVKESQP
jgi:hypothetical protein